MRKLRIAIAQEQLEYWMIRWLKGIELAHLTDLFVDQVEFWVGVLRANGFEPFPMGTVAAVRVR